MPPEAGTFMNRPVPSFVLYFLVFIALLAIRIPAEAQTNAYPYKIALDRMLFHDKVTEEQKRLLILGGGSS